MSMNMYPWPPYYPTPFTPNNPKEGVTELKRLLKLYKQMSKEEKPKEEKKDDKKKSTFTTLQWTIILCAAGPILAPWVPVIILSSFSHAMDVMKAMVH